MADTGWVATDDLVRTTEEQRGKLRDSLVLTNAAWNEVLWTYLVADVISRIGDRAMTALLGSSTVSPPLWFEAKPVPPREREGNTCLDLAAGAIRLRTGTANGIEYDPSAGNRRVVFVEAKVRSDCSIDVAYDPTRNQIVRVIENLLCFQGDGKYPDELHFTLLTPNFFRKPPHRRTRLYGYKFDAYAESRASLLDDIHLSKLEQRKQPKWSYPTLEERVERLNLHWCAYEDVFAMDPELAGIDVMACTERGELPKVVRMRLQQALGLAI